ncbi:uncharacterized protein V1516DRAFT_15999 [Lipomyces oligophaga]|uniref:uncharacterized protein n=1 Tax=Lipomyces oligophaga TaxID=45792 RepID=UPI0034CF68C4
MSVPTAPISKDLSHFSSPAKRPDSPLSGSPSPPTSRTPPSPGSPEPVSRPSSSHGQNLAGLNTNAHTSRPTPVRVPSNTYAPVRRPTSNEPNRRPARSSSTNRATGGRKQRPPFQHPYSQHSHNSDNSHVPRATDDFEAQQRFYFRRMRDDLDDEYYTRVVSQQGYNDSDDEEESPQMEIPNRSDFRADFYDSDISTPSVVGRERDELTSPKNKERLEWQAMLTAVLTGEVVRSEKSKLKIGQSHGISLSSPEVWLEIRAKVCGRSLAMQRKIVEDQRKEVPYILEDFMRFQIQGKDECSNSPEDQIKNVLHKLENCEALWRSTKRMREDIPIANTPDFIRRHEALLSWVSITDSINSQIGALKKWTGNDDLDLTRTPEIDAANGAITDHDPFIERIFKENDFGKVFDAKIITMIRPLIVKARQTTIEQGPIFEEMRLPSYLEDLLLLLNFPTRLIQEIIRNRLSYSRKLMNPTMMMIDQMLDVYRVALQQAIIIKQSYTTLSDFKPGWELPTVIDENFDTTLLDGLSFYLELLNRKLLGGSKTKRALRIFREAEYVEGEWNSLKDVGKFIEGADLEIAEQFSMLTAKLLVRIMSYFDRQVKATISGPVAEIQKTYLTAIEHVRGFHRKSLRFSKILEHAFENTAEYAFEHFQMSDILSNLHATGHFLVSSPSLEDSKIYVIADSSLLSRPEMLQTIVHPFIRTELGVEDETYSYAVLIYSSEPLRWPAPAVHIDLPELKGQIDLKADRLRIVADGSGSRLRAARNRFTSAVGDACSVITEQRSNFPRIDRELAKIRRNFYKLAMLIISSVDVIRKQCKGHGLQDLVNSFFNFAREIGQRAMQYFDSNRRTACALKLVYLSIDWVSFVCDDCEASEKRTFQFSVDALEFARQMTRGVNILAVNDEDFSRLRVKVAGCMTLLISHFDVMGARSSLAAALEAKKQEKAIAPLTAADMDDEDAICTIERLRAPSLELIEESRRIKQEEQHSVGKVLDDSNSETQYLMFLSSSLSNVSIRWQQGRFIGGGTFGSVYAAINLETGDVMAVKEIRFNDSQSIRHIVKSIKDEMTVLEMLSHPNIVQYFGVEVHREKVFIFMEYCEGGSLASLLEHGRIEDETVSQVYTLQMLEGLAYLHESGIVHRDIKPENILLDHMGVIKFVDFGAAKVIAQKGKTRARASTSTKLNSMTGTPMYMSPEVITGSGSGRHGSVDIWSMGCCVLEMATGRRPWVNLDNEWAIMYHIAAGQQPTLPTPDQITEDGLKFITRCFERDPYVRASAIELLDDPWIRSIRMDSYAESPTP